MPAAGGVSLSRWGAVLGGRYPHFFLISDLIIMEARPIAPHSLTPDSFEAGDAPKNTFCITNIYNMYKVLILSGTNQFFLMGNPYIWS